MWELFLLSPSIQNSNLFKKFKKVLKQIQENKESISQINQRLK